MSRLNAEISAGSLMPLESKRIATLLLTHPSEQVWTNAIEVENILQKNTPSTARRQSTLIRKRLLTLDDEGWTLICERESEIANQLLLAAAVKHSELLGEFMRVTYANSQRRLEPALAPLDWEDFLADCAHRDANVATWSSLTKAKLFQVIIRILVECKFLESSKSMRLSPRSLHPVVRRYLVERNEKFVLDCLERTK